MRRTVFYSWQSDVDASVCRSLIEDALKRALRSIKKSDNTGVEPVLDRDTAGLAGSPAISDAIFAKIAFADVFVADVTIVNPRARGRRTPNPNVLIELGYAVSTLGWNRILLIQNTAFGSPDELPFDLRGRRVVIYNLQLGAASRAEVRGLLQGRLESALRSALIDSAKLGVHAGPEVPLWWGTWHIPSEGSAHGGQLVIRQVGSAGFLFDLSVYSGAHSGELPGFARLVSADLAYSRIEGSSPDELCELAFHRRMIEGRREIQIEETGWCFSYHGMGATFSAIFVRRRESLFDGEILDEIDLQRLCSVTGKYYDAIADCFQGLSETENLDHFHAKATVGGVRGLYTIMEGILMKGGSGELWVAYIDGDVVRYFTTERGYRDKLPLTIEHWRERFKSKPVVFDSEVDRIPKDDFR